MPLEIVPTTKMTVGMPCTCSCRYTRILLRRTTPLLFDRRPSQLSTHPSTSSAALRSPFHTPRNHWNPASRRFWFYLCAPIPSSHLHKNLWSPRTFHRWNHPQELRQQAWCRNSGSQCWRSYWVGSWTRWLEGLKMLLLRRRGWCGLLKDDEVSYISPRTY